MKPRGRFLVEFAVVSGFAGLLLSGSVTLLRALRERQAMDAAARLGTLLQRHRGVASETARFEAARYLFEQGVHGARITVGRYTDTSASRFYDLAVTRVEKETTGFPPVHIVADVVCEREEE